MGNNFGRHLDSYLVSQQHIPDLSQILLGEDKAHISFNVGQKSVKSHDKLLDMQGGQHFYHKERLLNV